VPVNKQVQSSRVIVRLWGWLIYEGNLIALLGLPSYQAYQKIFLLVAGGGW